MGMPPKRWAKTNTAHSTTHLLHGIVGCGRCGKRLYVAGSKEQPRAYQCLSGQGLGKDRRIDFVAPHRGENKAG